MDVHDKINILMVDDQLAKLLSYEVILRELGENLIPAASGREALAHLFHTDIAVVLIPTTLLNGYLMQASFPVREIGTVLTLLHARYELEDLIRMEHFQG